MVRWCVGAEIPDKKQLSSSQIAPLPPSLGLGYWVISLLLLKEKCQYIPMVCVFVCVCVCVCVCMYN